jgi:hypothetical protein
MRRFLSGVLVIAAVSVCIMAVLSTKRAAAADDAIVQADHAIVVAL